MQHLPHQEALPRHLKAYLEALEGKPFREIDGIRSIDTRTTDDAIFYSYNGTQIVKYTRENVAAHMNTYAALEPVVLWVQ